MTPAHFQLSVTPLTPDDEISMMLDLAELVVRDNLRWMQAQEQAGIEVPCCASCAGVKYVPPTSAEYRSANITIDGAQMLLKKKRGACGSIAAYDAAAKRLEGVPAEVLIVPQGGNYYHAVIGTPDGVIDPTAKMESAAAPQHGGKCACSGS